MAERWYRVLVVEDHDDVREATTALLQTWGHTVRNARDGRDGLAIALSWQPEIVCLDLMLPGMNGAEVARRIIAAFGDDRPMLLAITGYGRDVDRDLAIAVGFDAFLVKPYEPTVLRAILDGDGSLPTSTPAGRRRP